MEALIASHSACDLTFHPGDALQGRRRPRNRTSPSPQQISKKQCHNQHSRSTSSSRYQAASCAGFYPFHRCLLFSLLLFFDSGWIDYWRGCLGTQALCKKADLEAHRSVVVGHQCRLRGSSGACFIFRCQGYTHTHTKNNTL